VSLYAENSNGAVDYNSLAEELLAQEASEASSRRVIPLKNGVRKSRCSRMRRYGKTRQAAIRAGSSSRGWDQIRKQESSSLRTRIWQQEEVAIVQQEAIPSSEAPPITEPSAIEAEYEELPVIAPSPM
jgi:hypothetical protein